MPTPETTEIQIGEVVFRLLELGAHARVEVRGMGIPGQRPLLGTLVMTPDEWASMVEHQAQARTAERIVGEIERLAAWPDASVAEIRSVFDGDANE